MIVKRLGGAVRVGVFLSALTVPALAAAPNDQPPPPPAAQSWTQAAIGAVEQPFILVGSWVGSWLGGWLGAAESALASEKQAFAETLKNDLVRFQRLVGDAGFSVAEIRVAGGLEPEISLTLEVRRPASDEEEEAIRRRIADDVDGAGLIGTIERALLLALLDIDEAAESFRPDGYALASVEVDIGLLPSFAYLFTPVSP
jgi:hypothetical protein